MTPRSLALGVLLLTCACGASARRAGPTTSLAQAERSSTDEDPGPAEAPAATDTPTPAEAPAATEAPGPDDEDPSLAEAPGPTQAPASTDTPVLAQEPEEPWTPEPMIDLMRLREHHVRKALYNAGWERIQSSLRGTTIIYADARWEDLRLALHRVGGTWDPDVLLADSGRLIVSDHRSYLRIEVSDARVSRDLLDNVIAASPDLTPEAFEAFLRNEQQRDPRCALERRTVFCLADAPSGARISLFATATSTDEPREPVLWVTEWKARTKHRWYTVTAFVPEAQQDVYDIIIAEYLRHNPPETEAAP